MCTAPCISGVRSRLVRWFKLHMPDPRGLRSVRPPRTCTHTHPHTRAADFCVFTQAKSGEWCRDAVARRKRGREEEGWPRRWRSVPVSLSGPQMIQTFTLFVCKRTKCAVPLQPPADTYYCDSLRHTQTRARTGSSQSERRRSFKAHNSKHIISISKEGIKSAFDNSSVNKASRRFILTVSTVSPGMLCVGEWRVFQLWRVRVLQPDQ